MNAPQVHIVRLTVSVALALSSGGARAAGPEQPEGGAVAPVHNVGIMVLGGLAAPFCGSQQGCDGNLSTGPSLAGLVLYGPSERWAFGVAAQVSRSHWREPYLGMTDGNSYEINADLLTGLVAIAAHYTFMPAQRVTPIIQAALGTGFQTQTGSNFHCNNGFIPTGQFAVGARGRTSAHFSLLGLATATFGLKTSECAVSDGPATTPFAGWGLALHLGAAFDLVL